MRSLRGQQYVGIEIIRKEGGKLVGIIVAFDMVEKTPGATDDDDAPA